ncbi:hypothetical protein [Frankia sp. R82]|uniref:hypothetical protein n=1 Tax=Frankia sp. R82 TaxID=2950553 RepID=UPI0020448111|nr:hypothetical protein [Frankia sp. R82]MCM3885058.1 hypothetical protein [Frankia sp. R82]
MTEFRALTVNLCPVNLCRGPLDRGGQPLGRVDFHQKIECFSNLLLGHGYLVYALAARCRGGGCPQEHDHGAQEVWCVAIWVEGPNEPLAAVLVDVVQTRAMLSDATTSRSRSASPK